MLRAGRPRFQTRAAPGTNPNARRQPLQHKRDTPRQRHQIACGRQSHTRIPAPHLVADSITSTYSWLYAEAFPLRNFGQEAHAMARPGLFSNGNPRPDYPEAYLEPALVEQLPSL